MERGPRGLIARACLTAGLFAVAVVPGWTFGDLAEQATGRPVLDWLITCGWCGLAVAGYAPWTSYRLRDGLAGVVPLYGWYLAGMLSWRIAALPYRDWEPRRDELWRARWLTGRLVGYWRIEHLTSARPLVASRRTR